MALLVRSRSSRPLYTAIAVATILSMVGAPLASAALTVRFNNRVASQSASPPLDKAISTLTGAPSDEAAAQNLLARLAQTLPESPKNAVPQTTPLGSSGTGLNDCRTLYSSEGVDPNGDDDNDGLKNSEEWCLGTDFKNVDSDDDTITDTLEVKGYTDSHGKTWLLDPLAADTNLDGIDDGSVCYVDSTTGKFTCSDIDGDGIPDAWDDDIDNDGVLNADDLSPTDNNNLAYRPKMEIDIAGSHPDTVVYVDVQLQPQAMNHLRYSTTWLDWPDDSAGQIQDLNHSTQDVELLPVLQINSPVNPSLAEEYSIASTQSDDKTYYQLTVPLQTVGTGGQVSAFSGHIAFTAKEVGTSLKLSEGRLLWLTQAQIDSYTNCKDSSKPADASNCEIDTQPSVISAYYEPLFRVTGLELSESKNVQVALFGTTAPETTTNPNVDDEGKVMFNLLSGLAPTFLGDLNPTLPQIVDKFAHPAQGQTITDTWYVDPKVTITNLGYYSHTDQALSTTSMTTTVQFLNQHYIECKAGATNAMTPTLVTAYEETNSGLDPTQTGLVTVTNGEPNMQNGNPIVFNFQLAQSSLNVVRSVQLTQYGCRVDPTTSNPTWQALTSQEGQAEIQRRYPNETQADYGTMMMMLFGSYYEGRSRVMSIDGQPTPDVGQTANPSDLNQFFAVGTHNLPAYMRTAYQLDALVLDIKNKGTSQALDSWATRLSRTLNIQAFVKLLVVPMVRYVKYAVTMMRYANFWATRMVRMDTRLSYRIMAALVAPFYAFSFRSRNAELQFIVRRELKLSPNPTHDLFDHPRAVASGAKRAKIKMVVIGGIVTAIAVVATWLVWHKNNGGDINSIQQDTLLAQTIASTVLTVFMFVVDTIIALTASTGVGFLIELIILIITYIVVAAISGDWNPMHTFQHLIEWLSEAILKIDMLVNDPDVGAIPSQPSLTVHANPANQTAFGSIADNLTTYEITMTMVTTLTANTNIDIKKDYWHMRQGNLDDVKQSWAFAEMFQDPDSFNGNPPAWTSNFSVKNSAVTSGNGSNPQGFCDSDSLVDAQKYKRCYNTTSMTFNMTQSGPNLTFPFLSQLEANLRYQKCWYAGVGFTCSADINYSKGPDKTQDPENYQDARSSVTMDAVPATLDALWTWDVKNLIDNSTYPAWNTDKDGDGISTATEQSLGTDSTKWDTDNDGLSDGFEYDNRDKVALDPKKADTDGDGLSDRLELIYGTDPTNADTDNDGLSDGEEVCRFDATQGKIIGGWDVKLASGLVSHVCSDPTKGDYDGDGLLDSQEKAAGTSPYAPNTAPSFVLNVTPTTTHNGSAYTLLKPGDSLQTVLNLNNTTTAAVNQPMTLSYDTAALSGLAVSQQTGSSGYTPPTPTATSGGFSWNLTQKPLAATEAMTSTIGGKVQANVGMSARTVLQASVPYSDTTVKAMKTVSSTQTVLIDADAPSSLVTAPTPSQAVHGTAFTLGGTATDPTSWPSKVEVHITGASYDSHWQQADGTDIWDYTWTPLPADGVYTIASRATDAVNHVETPAAGVSMIVDNTPPSASFGSLADGQALKNITYSTVTITGTASDLVSHAPQVAGLATVQLSIDNQPWRNVKTYTSDHPATGDWSFAWKLADQKYGSHTLAVRAIDAGGLVGAAQQITVIVDTLPPTDMWSNAASEVQAGKTVTFEGHADDTGNVPLPARPVALEGGVSSTPLNPIDQATVWLMPNGPTEDITKTVTWLGDVDGDGRADMAVGTPGSAINGAANAGRVSILYGQPGGWPLSPDGIALKDSPSTFTGKPGAELGAYVASAGDVNGDGLSDILIGDPLNNQVYLIFSRVGPMGALDPTSLINSSNKSKGKIFTVNNGYVGKWFAPAGDVNGDGYGDILIGATNRSDGKGLVYLVLGGNPSNGPLSVKQKFTLDDQQALSRPIVAASILMDKNGAVATGLGDVNNDQYADFAIGDPNKALSGANSASVYVFFGGPSYVGVGNPTVVNPVQGANGRFTGDAGMPVGSQVVALGDVNGDQLPDFAYSSGNAPRIAYGRTSGWSMNMTANVSFTGYPVAPNGFIAGVGDVNSDGKSDIMLGTVSGRAYLVRGAADLATNHPIQAQFSDVGAAASAPYAAAADVNCDKSSDLLLVPFGTQMTASAKETAEYKRAVRRELDLGPSTAPRPLNELPVFMQNGDGLAAPSAFASVIDAEALSSKAMAEPGQVMTAAQTRYVDDDYCASCANDGHAWGTTAFSTIQAALDAATGGTSASAPGDTIIVGPGTYDKAVFHAGKNFITLHGVDPDAVFIDAGGGTGIQVLPASEYSPTAGGLKGVVIENLTIRNAVTSIEVNYGGTAGSTDLADQNNIRVRNVLFYQDKASSKAVAVNTSGVELRHNTLVANSSGIVLIQNTGAITNALYLRDNLFVALPNAAPLPQWLQNNNSISLSLLNTNNGFAGQTGTNADWNSAKPPTGTSMTQMALTQAAFRDQPKQVFRLLSTSLARGKAADQTDLGYYTYHAPVYVNPTYCEKCSNNGHTWGVDAFNDIQAGINSGAQRVLIEPGLFRQRIYLVNGVDLFGTGAALTVIAPPNATSSFLIGAEGVKDAGVALLTITGEDHDDGLHVDAGGFISVTRSVIRNTPYAVKVTGSGTGATSAEALLVNNTLTNNTNGVAAASCGNVDVRNTIFAYHTGTALSYYQNCATTYLHTYNDFWRNGHDLSINGNNVDQPGPGEVFADPRFIDPDAQDFRPQDGSPVVRAGDPRDPTPPGTGGRVDIGYAQSSSAAVYVSPDYCAQCINDGLQWQVNAFNTIKDGISHVPPIAGEWTVGVAPGYYTERVAPKSGVRLVGSGAEQTIIDADGTGAPVTLNGVTHVEVTGFGLQNSDASNAGIVVSGASNTITVTHNIMQLNAGGGAIFRNASSGVFGFNTVANNTGDGLTLADSHTWVNARFNIFAYNGGKGANNNSVGLFQDGYNLFYQNSGGNTSGTVTLDPTDIANQDPQFFDPNPWDPADYTLQATSPAVNAVPATDWQPVPLGGGDRADLGYKELLATPVTLMFGKQGTTCGAGNAGVSSVEVGVSYVPDASVSPENTLPTTWTAATLTTRGQAGSYWTLPINLATGGGIYQSDGLYRLYTRPTDMAGNTLDVTDSRVYRASFIADKTAPTVSIITPTNGLATSAAAVAMETDVSDYVATGAGTQYNVARVYFEVDGTQIAARQLTAGAATGNQRYRAVTALRDGSHSITAKAVDKAGNVGQSATSQITVSTTRNEADLTTPAPSSAVISTTLPLQGYVHFKDTSGNGQVKVKVDNSTTPVIATLDDSTAQATRWTANVTLSAEGAHTLAIGASRTTGASTPYTTTFSLTKDSTAPAVTVQAPSSTVINSVTFQGTASDGGSGLNAVEVSVDGGYTWSPATVNGTAWTYAWAAPSQTDYATFPLRVRGIDKAGNIGTQSATFVVDNLGPTPFRLTTASPIEGSHLTAPASVTLAWQPLDDGSGTVRTFASADTISNTVPSTTGTPLSGTSYTAQLSQAGNFYIHLAAQDAAGNLTVRHFGPWFVGARLASAPGPQWQSSIQVDGRLDVAGGEWDPATEQLDRDPRISPAHEMWASFDGSAMYLGSRGANWPSVGRGYIYLDTVAGGTRSPWVPEGETPLPPSYQLPFDADTLVVLDTAGSRVLRFDGSSWQPLQAPEVSIALGATGDSEIRLPWSTLQTSVGAGDVRALAFSLGRDETLPRTVFPTSNSLLGAWSDAYHWAGISPSTVPNADQPHGHHVEMTVSSQPPTSAPVGPGQSIQYVVRVTNRDLEPRPNAHLVLATTDGLQLVGLQGYPTPPGGQRWNIDLGSLASGALAPITVTARLGNDLAATTAVTMTALLETGLLASEPTLTAARVAHTVDAQRAQVQIDLAAQGATLPAGRQIIRGTATAGPSGVGKVEVRLGDGAWQTAQGANAWQAEVDIPLTGTLVVAARASDAAGLVGDATTRTITVDNVPPIASVSPPDSSIVYGVAGSLRGTARDLFPSGGSISRVETQVDGNPWRMAEIVGQPAADGTVTWQQTWTIPKEEGVSHDVRVRAVDAAGNVGQPSEPIKVTVDNVRPQSSIVSPQPGATLPLPDQNVLPGEMLAWGYALDGWGVTAVEVSVDGGQAWHRAEIGQAAAELLGHYGKAAQAGTAAQLWAIVLPTPVGDVMVNSRAIDRAGNVEGMKAPVRVTQTHEPPMRLWLPLIIFEQ
ncbi:MAG: Ig-like domain-containing protein [Anaerolineae bacterium]